MHSFMHIFKLLFSNLKLSCILFSIISSCYFLNLSCHVFTFAQAVDQQVVAQAAQVAAAAGQMGQLGQTLGHHIAQVQAAAAQQAISAGPTTAVAVDPPEPTEPKVKRKRRK